MAPATPTRNEDTAKAESLVVSGLKPMISAAMSISRIAIQPRPICERTRFFVARASTETMISVSMYFETAVSMAKPKISIGGAEITPEGS